MASRSSDHEKQILSTLWIFVLFNFLYVDLAIMIFRPQAYLGMAAKMSEWVVLGFSVLLAVPLAMVLLARVLPYRWNRWANIIAGIEATLFQASTLLGGKGPLFYYFFSAIEITTTLFIVWYAWKWSEEAFEEPLASAGAYGSATAGTAAK